MSDDGFDVNEAIAGMRAASDQACASIREFARMTMAYHSELVDGGCEPFAAMAFTEAMITSAMQGMNGGNVE